MTQAAQQTPAALKIVGDHYLDPQEHLHLTQLKAPLLGDLLDLAEDRGADLDALEAFVEMEGAHYINQHRDAAETLDAFESAYQGEFSSIEEYAEEYVSSTGMLDGVPETVRQYFDYEAFARDLRLSGDVCEQNGYIFITNY